MRARRSIITLIVALIIAAVPLGGCYYMQAASGQLELLRKREPIDELIASGSLEDGQAARLELVLEVRQFAVDELGLPDNDSYRSYADLEREFVLWNVFATPEFSLVPKTWCYPIVGCLAYRGYFSERQAERVAARLSEDGFDVYVGGVPAYSTLGRFDDPVLNTMLRWPNADLVSTLIHELAHQRLFIRDDTTFNESFATAVADIGLQRWAAQHPESIDLDQFERGRRLSAGLLELAGQAREDLLRLFGSQVPDDEMRRRKAARLDRLAADATALAAASGFANAGWLRPPLNNARLSSVSLYTANVAAFKALYRRCGERLECLYDEAERMGALSSEDRDAALQQLAAEFGARAAQ